MVVFAVPLRKDWRSRWGWDGDGADGGIGLGIGNVGFEF